MWTMILKIIFLQTQKLDQLHFLEKIENISL